MVTPVLRKRTFALALVNLIAVAATCCNFQPPRSEPRASLDSLTQSRLEEAYRRLPLSFEANQGQADPHVDFVARAPGYSVFLSSDGATLAFPAHQQLAFPAHQQKDKTVEEQYAGSAPHGGVSLVRMGFLNGNPTARARALGELPGKSNYFLGKFGANWRSGVSTFAEVEYADVYPGVDVNYHGTPGSLEYDLRLAPNANLSIVQLAFQGANGLRVDSDGNLIIGVGNDEIVHRRPIAYQNVGASKQQVPVRYVITSEQTAGFAVSMYDHQKPLVIDPVIGYSTYLGGTFNDQIYAIAVDSAGNAYVTGSTFATNFPITPGAFQTSTVGIGTTLGGGGFAQTDVFITKFNSAGNAVIYSTYLGGTDSTDQSLFFVQPARGNDEARGIAVDSDGQVYVTGTTTSNNDFPVTANAIQKAIAPNAISTEDVFVTKLNGAGNGLIYSTRLGGAASDTAAAIAIDANRNAYITGYSQSADFPMTPGAFRGSTSGAFVSKLKADGSGLVYSASIGAGIAHALVIDAQGNAYVTGETSVATFPTTPGAFQTAAPDGGNFINAFVAKLNPAGDSLVYSTYLGGRLNDWGYGIAIDDDGNAYVAGASDSNNFPTTPGAFKTASPGSFVTKLNPSGTALAYSTIIGPSILGIALNSAREAYLIGQTGSGSISPTPDAFQSSYGGGGSDAFMMKLNAAGSAVTYSTYLGGANSEAGQCIALDSSGGVYVAGTTSSSNFPVSSGAFQVSSTAGSFDVDSFVTKFVDTPSATFKISGRITDGNGNGLGGVPVILSGSSTGTQWTVANGNYSFGNLPAGGSYTITPSPVRFNFMPLSRALNNLTSDQTADFSAVARNQIFFSPSTYRVNENNLRVPITVNRIGDTTTAATVDYATSDGSASERKDYNTTVGTLRFAAGETTKSFDVLLTDDSFAEANETVFLSLSSPTGGVEVGTPSSAVITIISNDAGSSFNPADSASFFVRQHYIDFLNRLPDAPGQNFWTSQITSCGSDAACLEVKRINVSGAFFLSIEFQETGYLVERLYKTAYGDAAGNSTFPSVHTLPVPMVRFNEFLADTQEIGRGVVVGQPGWELQIENNKAAFTAAFVQRQRFINIYAPVGNAQFVDMLNANANFPLSPSERSQLVSDLRQCFQDSSPGVESDRRASESGQRRIQSGVCANAVLRLPASQSG
jgi:Calx-beta domain/Beta-propeller repeat